MTTKQTTQTIARAPGSTFLMGEHAVLRGHGALVMAVNRWITIKGSVHSDSSVVIDSTLGLYRNTLENLARDHPAVEKKHRFVHAVLQRFLPHFTSGFALTIESDFSHQLGLASSAAVTVALVGLLSSLFSVELNRMQMLKLAISIIREVQGAGSGADAAASLSGGVIAFNPPATEMTVLSHNLPLQLYYSGYKTPTPEVIARVAKMEQNSRHGFDMLYQQMGDCTLAACKALQAGDLPALGDLMGQYHGLMKKLGVSDHRLDEMIALSMEDPETLGAKISGSGLGDCIVVLKKPRTACVAELENCFIPACTAPEGLTVESHTC